MYRPGDVRDPGAAESEQVLDRERRPTRIVETTDTSSGSAEGENSYTAGIGSIPVRGGRESARRPVTMMPSTRRPIIVRRWCCSRIASPRVSQSRTLIFAVPPLSAFDAVPRLTPARAAASARVVLADPAERTESGMAVPSPAAGRVQRLKVVPELRNFEKVLLDP